jgi:hypothetical protein
LTLDGRPRDTATSDRRARRGGDHRCLDVEIGHQTTEIRRLNHDPHRSHPSQGRLRQAQTPTLAQTMINLKLGPGAAAHSLI